MVAYTTWHAWNWEKQTLSSSSAREAWRGFIFPLSKAELSEDENVEAEDSDPELIDSDEYRVRVNARRVNRPEERNVLDNDELISAITERVTREEPTVQEVMEESSSSGSDDLPSETEGERRVRIPDKGGHYSIVAHWKIIKKLKKRRSRFLYDLRDINTMKPPPQKPPSPPHPQGWTLKRLRKQRRKYGARARLPQYDTSDEEGPEAEGTPSSNADAEVHVPSPETEMGLPPSSPRSELGEDPLVLAGSPAVPLPVIAEDGKEETEGAQAQVTTEELELAAIYADLPIFDMSELEGTTE